MEQYYLVPIQAIRWVPNRWRSKLPVVTGVPSSANVIEGEGPPNGTEGQTGDIYIDMLTGDYYELQNGGS